MKKRLRGPLLILGMLVFASSAMAAQPEKCVADDPPWTVEDGVAEQQELTPEQRETVAMIFDMHGERLHRLCEKIEAATTELSALAAAPKGDKDDTEELIARIDALRAQLCQERLAVRAELAADGITDFPSLRRGPCPGHVRSVSRPS